MRINFNSKISAVIWVIVWCITGLIATIGADENILWIAPVFYWTFVGPIMTDLAVERDWKGLKRYLIRSTIIIAIIIVISFYWD